VTRQEARRQLEEEARRNFKDKPEDLAAYMDAVGKALAEDARP
jgi:predicted secreted protein